MACFARIRQISTAQTRVFFCEKNHNPGRMHLESFDNLCYTTIEFVQFFLGFPL